MDAASERESGSSVGWLMGVLNSLVGMLLYPFLRMDWIFVVAGANAFVEGANITAVDAAATIAATLVYDILMVLLVAVDL